MLDQDALQTVGGMSLDTALAMVLVCKEWQDAVEQAPWYYMMKARLKKRMYNQVWGCYWNGSFKYMGKPLAYGCYFNQIGYLKMLIGIDAMYERVPVIVSQGQHHTAPAHMYEERSEYGDISGHIEWILRIKKHGRRRRRLGHGGSARGGV